MSERIAHAEWALALRSQHLFYEHGGHHAERQAVDAALYALFVLKSHTIDSDMGQEPESDGLQSNSRYVNISMSAT